MRRRRFQLWLVLVAAAALLSGCITGRTLSHPPVPVAASERSAHNLRVFDRACALVKSRFYDEKKLVAANWEALTARYRPNAEKANDDEALYYQVINPMFDELKTSHLVAISPQDAYEDGTEHRTLLGLRHERIENRWVVRDVIPGSSAEAAGVQRGWIVVKINGQPFGARHPPYKEGEEVAVEFADESDQPRMMTLTARSLSMVPRLESRELAGGMWYLRFDEFNRESRRWLSEQLKIHGSAPGVVVDLRQNPGGEAFSLTFALGEFFPRVMPMGAFVRRSGKSRDADSIPWRSAKYSGRVAVLVGPSTASCSEIFAHVLQYHKRAALIGQKTAGAVIASAYYALPGDGRLQIPEWDYRGLDGRRLEAEGVTPDVIVTGKLAELRAGRDPELEAALRELSPAPGQADAAGFGKSKREDALAVHEIRP